MNVLVVGGAGYIGSHVCKALLQAGHRAIVFDNLSSGLRQNILPGAEFIHGDILIPESIERACARHAYEAFIHLAALKAAGESMVDPEKYSRVNIGGTLNLLHAALRHDIGLCVFSSSAAVYGEPHYVPLDENHPVEPSNYYGYTKLQIEGLLQWHDRLRGLKFAALRYFNAAGYDPDGEIFGLEQNPANLLPVIMEVAVGRRSRLQIFGTDYGTRDGTGVRDYVHVADLAQAHIQALHWLRDRGESLVLNLGSDNGMSVLEMVDISRRLTGAAIPCEAVGRRPGDPATLIASSMFAEAKLGWKARCSDPETIIRTHWQAYRRNFSAG